MEISMERRWAESQKLDATELRFALVVRSLDVHTHAAITEADQQAIRAELVKAADSIEGILKNGPRNADRPPSGIKEEV